jgi:Tol biopolymer transport system component
MRRTVGSLLLLAVVGLGALTLAFPPIALLADNGPSTPTSLVYLPIIEQPVTPRPDQIAFTAVENNYYKLYLMDADGTNRSRVTSQEGHEEWPVWSPSGEEIAYFGELLQYRWSAIFVANPDTHQVREVVRFTRSIGSQYSAVTWSPDGTRIAYIDAYDIFTVNADGTNKTLIAKFPERTYLSLLGISWSPDGEKIAFGYAIEGSLEIFSIKPDGSGLFRLTYSQNSVRDIVWSPDSTHLAFSYSGWGRFDLCSIKSDGSSLKNLTARWTYALARQPSWSPDGSLIAFEDGGNVMTITPDGSHQHPIGAGAGMANPDWSPDGTRLAFVGLDPPRSTDTKIQVVNKDGSNLISLVDGYDPIWRPRGK